MSGLLVGQVVASKTLLTGLGISNEFIFVAFWAFVITYTMVGGLKAVVFTDVAQVLVIILIFFGIFGFGLLQEPASFFSPAALIDLQKQFDFKGISTSTFIATIMLPALFSLIEQDLAQRFFAARTKGIAMLSAFASSFFMLTFALIPIYLGMKANMLNLTVPTGASPLIPVIEALTNELVTILAVCGIIAAITSTADSLLCAVSSNIAQDFDFSMLGFTSSLTLSKYITLITGIVALAASYIVPQDIIGILIGSYEISVSCLLVPLLFCYFNPNVKRNAAWGGVLGGLTGYILFRIIPFPIPKEIASIGLSFLGYVIGGRIKKNF